MNISKPFIQRPVMTTLVMVAILFFGVLGYLSLPIGALPSIQYPTIVVSAGNPGADPMTMAADIATPIEQQLMAIPGMMGVLSQSISGTSTITCQFDLDMSLTDASTWVASALSQAQGSLPVDQMPSLPTYQRFNPSDSPIIYIAVTSESMTMGELYDWAHSAVGQRISMVSGVAQLYIYGAKGAVRIKINPDQCFTRGIGINEVGNALKQGSQLQPAGTLYNDVHQVTLQPLGQLTSGKEYENLMIAYRENGPVWVRDIGRAIDSTEIDILYDEYWNRKDGAKPTIVLAALREPNANTVKICDTITSLLPELQKQIPDAISLSVIHNTADLVRAGVWDVKFTLIVAFLLVVLVIFFFLGNITSTIIPALSLPMSIIGTFGIMKLLGYSIDILSMMALILVIGFLVDDAIVVLENIVRHLDQGKSPRRAALDGSRQISTTVLSMTLSLAAVFIPLIFMPGIVGRMFHEFAMVVVVAVLFSGFISLTLTPMLCSKVIRQTKKETRIHHISHKLMDALTKIYEPALLFCLRRGWVPISLAAGSCVVAIYLLTTIPQDFLPAGDTGVIQEITIAPQGIGPQAITDLQRQVADIVKDHPAVESLITVANLNVYYPTNEAVLFAMLKPENKRMPIAQVVSELEAKTQELMGGYAYFKAFPEINLNVSPTQSRTDYMFAMSTLENTDQMYAATAELTEAVQKLPGFRDVSNDMMINAPQLNFNIKRNAATTFGISADTIESAFALAYAEGQLDQFSTPVNTYRVILELEDKYKSNISSLDRLWLKPDIAINTNQPEQSPLVPLRSVADWELTTAPLTVNHVNQFTAATLFFNLDPGIALGPAIEQVNQLAEEILPSTVTRRFLGAALVFQGTMPALVALMFVGMMVIYLLLGILYESFIHPITILSALPGALFGALITLVIFDATLSIYSYIGIIVLVGIVMKNGIMLVEFANEETEKGVDAHEAIHRAALTRFRPILMTTIAAAMGALPIAIGLGAGSASRRPLGLAIVGGLIFAQLITYFFTPVVYLWFEYLQEWTRRRRANKKKTGTPP
jgi:hydrophobic/amphiphilic exporter-1 (mainly G- bacteria), HAE1 family